MRSFRWLVLVSLPLFSVLARAGDHSDLLSLSIRELMDVRVTGSTLTALPIEDAPNSITVFTRDDIRQLPVSTLEDLLNLVPEIQGIRSTDLSGTSMISIRGRRISYSSREILLLLNGMRIDNPHFGGFSTTYPALPLDNVERVEFIRGPGSAIYGSNAFTGVINIITTTRDDHAKLEIGSHQRRSGSVQYTGNAADASLHSSLFVNAVTDDGEALAVDDAFGEGTTQVRDPYRQFSLQWQLQYQEATRLQVVMSKMHADGGYAGGVADNANVNEPRQIGLMLEQVVGWHEDIDSKVQFGTQDWLLLNEVRPFTAVPIGTISTPLATDPLYFKSEVRTREYWVNWHNDWWLSPDRSVQFGMEYRNSRNVSVRAASNYDLLALFSGQPPITYYGNFNHSIPLGEEVKMDIVGVYAQYQQHWTRDFETVAGLRFDSYSSIDDNISPRLGLIYHAGDNDTVKLLWSQAFRAPQFDERFAINNPVITGNPGLKPETVETTELIWMHGWSAAWLSLNLFANRFHDAILLQPIGDTGARRYENDTRTSRSEGVSAELNQQLMQDLRLRFTMTHFFEIPDASFREAEELISAAAIYTHDRWTLSMTVDWNGERENLVDNSGATEKLDAYALSHLKLMYGLPTANGLWQTYVEVRNVFDEEYFTPANTDFNPGGVANHRRELRLGVAIDF